MAVTADRVAWQRSRRSTQHTVVPVVAAALGQYSQSGYGAVPAGGELTG
nr:hypothetical protein [Kribbella sp. VKM Ac-2571]